MGVPAANVSATIARQVANCDFERLPESTRRAAARAILDAIGVMAAASGTSEDVAPFVRYAGRPGTGRATIIGTGTRVSATSAAFANGAMAHALDFEDVYDAAPCHPNASAIPAGFAVAQHCGGIDGRDFLAAVTAGCELACRTALGVRGALEDAGWYPPPLIGALGAGVVAAKLLGNDTRRIVDTLSLLLMQLGAPGEIRHAPGSSLRATREAFPAQAAVTSALLAAAGVRGFEDPLGGAGGFFGTYARGCYDDRFLQGAWGERWLIDELSFKPWPSCRGTHGCVEMALGLAADHRIDWRDIRAIEIEIGALQRMLAEPAERKRAPATGIDAKFSLPYVVAVAFVHGEVTLDSFSPDTLGDASVLALAANIGVRVHDEPRKHHDPGGRMRVLLASGECFERSADSVAGGPAAPLSDETLIDKFVACCARADRPPPEARARDAAARILALHREPDVGQLLVRLFPDPH